MNSTLLFVTSVLAFLVTSSESRSYYGCEPCLGEECEMLTEVCKYRETRDPCGRRTCMSGPGQRCGGRDNHLGKCGAGLTCKCGICKGCSIDMILMGVIDCNQSVSICV